MEEVKYSRRDFTEADHEVFTVQGYLRLGQVLSAVALGEMQQRIDDIMLGRVRYKNMRLQYFDRESDEVRRTLGNEASSLSYRRIDDLEQDPVFLAYMQQALYRQITRRYIGEDIAVFRSMFMNKPAHWDQTLPWHQDVGQGWGIDDDPEITIWLALDRATTANGCMQIVPGSHRHGIINERHVLPPEKEAEYVPPQEVIDLEAEAGEAILLHNFLLHRSGENPTPEPRRAFSMTFMDAGVRTLDTGRLFPVIFGRDALDSLTVGDKADELVEKFYG